MFKRFHDKDKWHKPWYRKLSPVEKCAWDYITSECDNVGVWEADIEAAEYFIGGSLDWDAFRTKCNGNIHLMDNGKWWLVDFCRFQYPELSEDTQSRPLLSYIALLKKQGLWIPYLKGINTVQDKDKDKEQDKDKDSKKEEIEIKKIKHKYGEYENILLSDTEKERLIKELGQPLFDRIITFYSAWKKEKGKVSKDDNLTIRRWVIDAVKKEGQGRWPTSSAPKVNQRSAFLEMEE
jgi:hypothetical protein